MRHLNWNAFEMIPTGTYDKEGNGEWSSILEWPIIPLHSIVLPDGNVLSFGTTEQGNQGGQFVFDLWDPVNNVHRTLPNTAKTNIFCCNMSLDPTTGNVVIMGGDNNGTPGLGALSGRQDVMIFDYKTQELRDARPGDSAFDLKDGRYYGTTVTLPNGDVMMIGGRDKDYNASTIPEIFNATTGVRQLTGAEIKDLANNPDGSTLTSTDGNYWYPHAFVTSKGDVIVIEADGEKMFRITTSGAGTVQELGTLPFKSYTLNSSLMFETDKIVIAADDGGLWVGDLSKGTPSFTRVAQLDSARTDAGFVSLPDGRVAIVGGGSPTDQGNTLADGQKDIAIWNPADNSVTYQEDQALARLYHSSALILPDGTVFSGGGGAPGPLVNLNAEVYMPSYLFDANGNLAERPVITAAPTNVATGQTFRISVDDSSDISMVTMIRSGSSTHARNSDSRFEKLDYKIIDAKTVEVQLPQGEVPLPGVWMLTTIDKAGVPSVAKMLGIDTAPLVDTPDLVATTPIYNIESEQINGAFTITLEARFDDLDAAGYQRVFDYGNGAAKDNIWLGQVGTSGDMRFEVWRDGIAYGITAAGAIREGEIASWKVSVDPNGTMHLVKNGVELATGQGALPADVERTSNFVGASNWPADGYLRGMVRNLDIANNPAITQGDDKVDGTSGDDIIDSLGGNDTVNAGAGNDTVYESWGMDTLDGGAGIDTLRLDSPNSAGAQWDVDLLRGTGGSPTSVRNNSYRNFENIIGSDGDDRIGGSAGNNELSGGAGNDTIKGNGGSDTIDGGAGQDVVEMSGKLADYKISTQAIHNAANVSVLLTGPDGSVTTIKNVETVTFTGEQRSYAIADVIKSAPQAGAPTEGNDVIDGTAGNDTINALGGNDTIRGNGGSDTIDGGAGQDIVVMGGKLADYKISTQAIHNAANVSVLLTAADGSVTTIKNVETVTFTGEQRSYAIADVIKSVPQADVPTEGNDVIDGTAGNDTINALGGNDTIRGNGGSDTIDGGAGQDIVVMGGKLADYKISTQAIHNAANVSVLLTGPDGSVTTIKNVETVTFTGEQRSYGIDEVVSHVNTGGGTAKEIAYSSDIFVLGTAADEVFVVPAKSSDYGFSPTADRDGVVIWKGDEFRILYDVDSIRFTDRTVSTAAIMDGTASSSGGSGGSSGDGTDNGGGSNTTEHLYANEAGTQYITGTTDNDIFVVNGQSEDYGYGPTDDGKGIVIWRGADFDILNGVEAIRFTDKTVSLVTGSNPDTGTGTVQKDIADTTQYVNGTTGDDTFRIDANASDFGWGRTEDGGGHVVWDKRADDVFDILTNVEHIQFNDTIVDLT